MSQQYSYFRLLYPQLRKFSTSLLLKQSHYDALGISSKATQADVKSAYYKLSMVYHPDKNKDSEDAAKKFRDITAAYEVLGSVSSRKLYDRGLYFGDRTSSAFDEPAEHKFYRSREVRTRPPAPPGKTIYDFDEWSRVHYGKTFAKDMQYKQRQKMNQHKKEQLDVGGKIEHSILLVATMFLLGAYTLNLIHEKTLDQNDVRLFGDMAYVVPKSDKGD